MAKKKTMDIIIDNKPNSDMSPKERRLMELINGAEPKDDSELQMVKEINEIKGLLFSTIEQTKEDYENGVFDSFQPYTTSTNSTLKSFEEAMEFNNFHEGIHLGYILALKKSL